MADHTQTVTNSMNIFTTVPQLWNAFEWNENWGESGRTCKAFEKAPISNTASMEQNQGRDFVKAPVTNTMTFTEDLESIMRAWGIWDFVFTKPTTDGDEKVFDEFSKVSDGTDAFSKVSDGSTDWTEV
jgi:hypothetical protein